MTIKIENFERACFYLRARCDKCTMRRIFFAVLLVMVWATVAAADPFEDAVSAYRRGDYPMAVQVFRSLAEQGDPRAQNNLGMMYTHGQGVPQDNQEAVKWCRLAAKQGFTEAQFNLGVMYQDGIGLPQDYQQALTWYRKAAEQGNASAQNNLGMMYSEGQGVLQDTLEALKWIRLAAEQGVAGAQYNLGTLYRDGLGIPQDLVRAHMWYSVSTVTLGGYNGQQAMKNRDLLASRMTASQLKKSQEMARRCQETNFKECD